MAANDNEAAASVRRGQELLSARLGREVSEGDARAMRADLLGFFRVLAEWARAENAATANDNNNDNNSIRREGEGDES